LTRRTQNGGNGGKRGGPKATNARAAKRFAIRSSVNTMEAITKEDNPRWYDDIITSGRSEINAEKHASVPVEDEP
jgi:hypothetical protein